MNTYNFKLSVGKCLTQFEYKCKCLKKHLINLVKSTDT